MNQRYQIPKILHTATVDKHFIDSLTISKQEHSELKEYRKIIRAALKQGFKELRDKADSFESKEKQYIARLLPKFRTQGSFVYETLNNPAYTPPQQLDLDDGVYFPMQLVTGSPRAAKNLLFKLVDEILQRLADEKNWVLDRSKNTCSRLAVTERIHIDIPIYAIPEDRYEAIANEALSAREQAFTLDESPLLKPDEIYLALRNSEHWIQSDPMAIQQWFTNECRLHKRLRRVCRYLKAWRDFTWQKGGPSSIVLMVAAAETFDSQFNYTGKGFETDCQALLEVVRELPKQFSGTIYNPTDDSLVLFPEGMSPDDLEDIKQKSAELCQNLEHALCSANHPTKVVETLTKSFGDRIPKRPDWVITLPIAGAVRSTPAQPQEAVKIPKSMTSA